MPHKSTAALSRVILPALPLALLAGLAGCGDGSRNSSNDTSRYSSTANAAPAPAMATAQPVVSPDMMKQVQTKLRDAGYYKRGRIDGVWGRQTQAAVRSFQKDHSLTTSGELDVPTLQALNLAPTSNTADTAPATNPPPASAPPAGNPPPAATAPAANPPPPPPTNGQPPAR